MFSQIENWLLFDKPQKAENVLLTFLPDALFLGDWSNHLDALVSFAEVDNYWGVIEHFHVYTSEMNFWNNRLILNHFVVSWFTSTGQTRYLNTCDSQHHSKHWKSCLHLNRRSFKFSHKSNSSTFGCLQQFTSKYKYLNKYQSWNFAFCWMNVNKFAINFCWKIKRRKNFKKSNLRSEIDKISWLYLFSFALKNVS